LAAANTAADPFTPSWEINGGYWQWGRRGPNPFEWISTNTAAYAHGPTGPGPTNAHEGAIAGWNQTGAPNGAWSDDSKTAEDPCPAGFRVPTKAQWDAVAANNTDSIVGTWVSDATNYSAGRFFGPALMLPAAGFRKSSDGLLQQRGSFGCYLSSKEEGPEFAWSLSFTQNYPAGTAHYDRRFGFSIRCIAMTTASNTGTVGFLDCANPALTGVLTADSVANGVIVRVPYTGGDGGTHSGQTVVSSGVTGLTAELAAGNFASGSDSLSYTITGTPDTSGTAGFALDIGGQNCTLELMVEAGACVPETNCWAMVSMTDTLFFQCHNLASANPCADPFTPSWETNGGYWQWGRKGPDESLWLHTNTTEFAHGPAGPGPADANGGTIAGWNQTAAPNGAWSDASKTAEDPCPAGFRVPTKAQWDGVRENNLQSVIGTWFAGSTNYSAGRFFGPALMLPASGRRHPADGLLEYRGHDGYYWSSTAYEYGTNFAWDLEFSSGVSYPYNPHRRNGFSIRCAAE
jgi:uncharacterized protein (TIGR02145 family)